MATYCTDDDLLKYRPNILSLGVTSWEDQRQQAYEDINRIITAKWYRQAAEKMGYDPDLVEFVPESVQDDALKKLECYRTLEYAYMILMKDSENADGFERNMNLYAKLYSTELGMLLSIGIKYDWTGDGSIDSSENQRLPAQRRLHRG